MVLAARRVTSVALCDCLVPLGATAHAAPPPPTRRGRAPQRGRRRAGPCEERRRLTRRAVGATSLRTAPTRERFSFVMVDRFADGNPADDRGGLTGPSTATGHDPSYQGVFHGGDLLGGRRPAALPHRPARSVGQGGGGEVA